MNTQKVCLDCGGETGSDREFHATTYDCIRSLKSRIEKLENIQAHQREFNTGSLEDMRSLISIVKKIAISLDIHWEGNKS